jgi:hypothetical protein
MYHCARLMSVASQFMQASLLRHAGFPILSINHFTPLPANQGPEAYRGAITMRFQGNATFLSVLRSGKSCEALMPGKRPGMRLLARVINPLTYEPEHKIAGFLSEPFVVTTNRAKGRAHGTLVRTEPVQRLPGVGTETARKLLDFGQLRNSLRAALSAASILSRGPALMQTVTVETVRWPRRCRRCCNHCCVTRLFDTFVFSIGLVVF